MTSGSLPESVVLRFAEQPVTFDLEQSGLAGPPGKTGAPGPAGADGRDGGTLYATASQAINRLTVVAIDPDDTIRPASSLILADASRAIGIAAASALPGQQDVPVVFNGPLAAAGFPGVALFLAPDGSLTTNAATGLFQLQVAAGLTGDLVFVRLRRPIILAQPPVPPLTTPFTT